MKPALLFASIIFLSGCATPPISLHDRAAHSFQVPIKKLVVDNLSSESKIGVGDVIYVNGWVPAHAGFKPSLNESFVSKIRNSIISTGETGRADISVLRVGYFIEKTVADDIVFVGLFMAGRERGYKCDADINIKTEHDSQRITLTHEIRRSHLGNQEQTRAFIETCQTELIQQLADTIKKAI